MSKLVIIVENVYCACVYVSVLAEQRTCQSPMDGLLFEVPGIAEMR